MISQLLTNTVTKLWTMKMTLNIFNVQKTSLNFDVTLIQKILFRILLSADICSQLFRKHYHEQVGGGRERRRGLIAVDVISIFPLFIEDKILSTDTPDNCFFCELLIDERLGFFPRFGLHEWTRIRMIGFYTSGEIMYLK